jgi:hypothetical protein
MDVCIRCGGALISMTQDYCRACAAEVRLEVDRGMRLLERYLEAWAEFDEWSRYRSNGSRNGHPADAGFFPIGYSILAGAFADGSLASLQGRGAPLAIAARPRDGRYVTELVAYGTVELSEGEEVAALRVDFATDATDPGADIVLHLYNWRTKSWELLEPRGRKGDARLVVADPSDFVSPDGEVCLDMKAEHTQPFRTRTGLVRFTVQT